MTKHSKRNNTNSNHPTITTTSNGNENLTTKITKKRGSYNQYELQNMHRAVACGMKHSMSELEASKHFHIPRSTLQRYLHRIQLPILSTTTLPSVTSDLIVIDQPVVSVYASVNNHGKVVVTINVNDTAITDTAVNVILPVSATSGSSTIMTYEEEKAFSDWIITCSDLNIPTPKSICEQKASMILERRDSKFKTKTGLPSKEWWYGFYKRWPAVAPRKPQPLSKGKALLTKEHVEAFFTDLHSLSNTVVTAVSYHENKIHVYTY
jgi:hypothetical protein